MKVSVDPGLSGTGVAVWHKGALLMTETLYPKGAGTGAKLMDLHRQASALKNRILREHAPLEIVGVVVETPHIHTPKKRLDGVFKNAMAVGALIAALGGEYTTIDLYVRNSKDTKMAANLLCLKLKVEGSQHARDAVHIGFLVGYGDDHAKT